MSYWHQMYPQRQRSERVEVENGAARFESLLAKDLKDADRKFAESLSGQLQDQGKLSPKQVECLVRMEARYSPASVLKREQWAMSYRGAPQEIAKIVARYYRSTQYFRDLASKILLDEDFIPTERQFESLTKNKYAKKAIAAATNPPAFPVGSLCRVRANYNLVSDAQIHNEVGLVVENHPGGLYASSTLLVNGIRVKLEDRCLKSSGAASRQKK